MGINTGATLPGSPCFAGHSLGLRQARALAATTRNQRVCRAFSAPGGAAMRSGTQAAGRHRRVCQLACGADREQLAPFASQGGHHGA